MHGFWVEPPELLLFRPCFLTKFPLVEIGWPTFSGTPYYEYNEQLFILPICFFGLNINKISTLESIYLDSMVKAIY